MSGGCRREGRDASEYGLPAHSQLNRMAAFLLEGPEPMAEVTFEMCGTVFVYDFEKGNHCTA
ncbi:hypothetical protein [Roseovarius sp. TE539]|uniref:hypothetical protein n=1 Tax=Roseovarius sp. TE539 TaxID=2249812 RepID=UPI0011BD521E|nr:hypothetical protein [Roseovarius sp. TE539]